jgi:CelD/BcsL family acetyltransferase involved in cellulose biosynthesis
MLRTEIVDDLRAFDRLAPWWNRQPGPSESIFLRTEWFRTVASSALGPNDRLKIWVVSEDDEPRAALPTFQSGPRLRSLTETATESFDMIYNGDHDAVDHLVADLILCSQVRFEALGSESPLVAATGRYPGWHQDHRTTSAEIDLSAGVDNLLAGMSKNLRTNLQRADRALKGLGDLTTVSHAGPGRMHKTLADGLALEGAGWKGDAGNAVINSPRRLRFFTELAEVAEANNWLRLGALYLDGRMIAFNYDLEYAGRMVGLLTAYDETLPRGCSPGNVLLLRTLQAAERRRVTAYEMGSVGGRKSGKLQWTSQMTPRVYIRGFGPDVRGRAAGSMWQVRNRIRELKRLRNFRPRPTETQTRRVESYN